MSHHRTSRFFDPEAVRTAVAHAQTQADALRALGQVPHADNYRRLRDACARYRLEVPRRAPRDRAPKQRDPGIFANDAAVRAAVEGADSAGGALRSLGVAAAGKNYTRLDEACVRLGLPRMPRRHRGGHGGSAPRRPGLQRLRAADRATLASLTSHVRSLGQLVEAFDLPVTAEYTALARERLLELDVPVPDGRDPWRESDVFCVGRRVATPTLRRWIRRYDLLPWDRCAWCGLGTEWQGKPIVLELDHINGDRLDNRLSNLRFLCPNCHSQTPTFRNRRRPS